MRKLIYLLIVLLSATQVYSQWFMKSQLPNKKKLTQIQFINDNTGYVLEMIDNYTGNRIYKTTNGGDNWTLLWQDSTISYFKFINENTGFYINWNTTTRLHKTINGGSFWYEKELPQINNWNSVDINDKGCIGFTGPFIAYFSSTNGDTFKTVYLDGNNRGKIIKAISPRLFMIGCDYWQAQPRYLYFTKNSLDTVYRVFSQTYEAIVAISYLDTNRICYTDGSKIFVTLNGPNNIYRLVAGGTGIMKDISFVSDTAIYVLQGRFAVRFPTVWNGTYDMQRVISDNQNFGLNNMFFSSVNTGYICADSGYIFKTTNGGITAVNQNEEILPDSYNLKQNYPNPFNPVTTISYEIPKTSNIVITIYDIKGNEVRTLVYQKVPAGYHEITFDGSDLSSGVYFYKLSTEDFSDTKKMMLLK